MKRRSTEWFFTHRKGEEIIIMNLRIEIKKHIELTKLAIKTNLRLGIYPFQPKYTSNLTSCMNNLNSVKSVEHLKEWLRSYREKWNLFLELKNELNRIGGE
jgi:hypothetical protein